MASNATATPGKAKPLASLTKLSPNVYLHRAASSGTAGSASRLPKAPRVIVLNTWMGASDPLVAKYLAQYQALWPTSDIVVIKCDPMHSIQRTKCIEYVRAAVTPILAAVDKTDDEPQVLLTSMSSGGHALQCLLTKEAFPGAGKTFPKHVHVFDSGPGQDAYGLRISAFVAGSKGWSRWLVAIPFAHIMSIAWFLTYYVFGHARGDPVTETRRWFNQRAELDEVRRTYIYSDADPVIPTNAVESHAAEAKEKGFDVRLEKFVGSPHVGHARTDPDRYWRIVKETWEGSV
jgi:hypothetical protein